MIKGTRIQLRSVCDDDLSLFKHWAQKRDSLWGPFQRFQVNHVPDLLKVYDQNGLLTRESALLMIETIEDPRVVGFVRYSLIKMPDAEYPHPEIGFGISDINSRKQGFGNEAVGLLIDYLFSSFTTERLTAFTDVENIPAKKLLEKSGFQPEGVLRKSYYRDGRWQDMAIYGLLREEWIGGES